MAKKKFLSVQECILAAPKEVQPVLRKIREEIRRRLPLAPETIAYNMPV